LPGLSFLDPAMMHSYAHGGLPLCELIKAEIKSQDIGRPYDGSRATSPFQKIY
jgi:hypothetical protein